MCLVASDWTAVRKSTQAPIVVEKLNPTDSLHEYASVAAEVGKRRDDGAFQTEYASRVERYVTRVAQAAGGLNFVGRDALLLRCARLESVFLGESAVVEDSTVVDTGVLSSATEKSVVQGKSDVAHAIVQWNSTVETLSIVRRSLLCECSHIERHGKVLDSLLGPNTSVAEGEVTASLVGPFVGFHHRSRPFGPRAKGTWATAPTSAATTRSRRPTKSSGRAKARSLGSAATSSSPAISCTLLFR